VTQELIKVEVKNLFRTENAGGGVFLGNDDKTFAIFIGPGELNALILAGGGIAVPRPLTHNLLDMILSGFNIEVRSIVITDLVDDAFHAVLTLTQGKHEVKIDCRPSDALVVALMRKKEVYVRRELFERVDDGDVLLSAMREEIQKARRKKGGDEKAEAETEGPLEPEGDDEQAPEGPKPNRKGKGKGSGKPKKDEHPEGDLGDVREIPGIDWKSIE
jgi:bifunctional DNase/RNase